MILNVSWHSGGETREHVHQRQDRRRRQRPGTVPARAPAEDEAASAENQGEEHEPRS